VDEETTKETKKEGGADEDPGVEGAENDDGTSQDG
jgi:hypothetical protein